MIAIWLSGGLGLLVSLSMAEGRYPRIRTLRRAWTVVYIIGAAILSI